MSSRRPPTGEADTAAPPSAAPPAASPRTTVESARRVVESVIVAAVTSTGLYLVGWVYTNAYYGRMSIDAVALDLTPPYIALQSVHVVQSLLEYPVLLLLLYLLSRVVLWGLPRLRGGMDVLQQRFGRLALLVANGIVIAPLVLAANDVGGDPALARTSSPLSEVASLMQLGGIALVGYALWLSLGPRRLLLVELQRRQLLPIALVFTLYLLDALVATAQEATLDAERLLTGASDSSVAVTFTPASGVQALPRGDLLLVTIRNGHYFVVVRQPDPPSRTPGAYAIPVRAVDAVYMERVNPAATVDGGLTIELFASPTAP